MVNSTDPNEIDNITVPAQPSESSDADTNFAISELRAQIDNLTSETKTYVSKINRVMTRSAELTDDLNRSENARVMGLCYSLIDVINELALYTPEDQDELSGAIATCNSRLTRIDEFDRQLKTSSQKKTTEPKVSVESVSKPHSAVKNVVSSGEATEEEIRNVSTQPPIETIKPAEKTVEVSISELPAPPVVEEKKPPLVSVPPVLPADPVKPVAPTSDDNELVVDTPDAPIVAGDDEPDKPEVDVVFGPIITDDDDMTQQDIDGVSLESNNIDVIESEEEVDKDPFRFIDDTKTLYNVKANSRSQMNAFLKKMYNANVEKQDVSAIRMFDFNPDDESFRKEYLASRNNMIASPRISRTGLLMSGHYEEVSSYGNWDLASIGRTVTNKSIDFVDREFALYNSIYEHIRYVSYSNNKPEFDEWAKRIYYPDHKSLFFGVYDANSVGKNHYTITCPYCQEDLSIAVENKDLAIAIDKMYSDKDLEKFITCREAMSTDFSALFRWARDTVVRKRLNHSKYIVEYRVPTLFDYFTTIATVRKISKRENKFINIEAIEDLDSDDALRIIMYLYISKIGLPSPIEGDSRKIKYIGISEKSDIIELINTLDIEDYAQLFTGKEVSSLLSRQAADYYIENTKCTNKECGKVIKHIALDPKDTFFFKIGEVMSTLRLMS